MSTWEMVSSKFKRTPVRLNLTGHPCSVYWDCHKNFFIFLHKFNLACSFISCLILLYSYRFLPYLNYRCKLQCQIIIHSIYVKRKSPKATQGFDTLHIFLVQINLIDLNEVSIIYMLKRKISKSHTGFRHVTHILSTNLYKYI
jgi:hypothetical protein